MPIKVECDECGKKYRIPDDRAGEWIECRDCGADIEVPEDDEWDDEPRRSQRASSGQRRRRPSSDRDEGLSPGTKRAIFGGIFAVTMIVGLVIALSGGGDAPAPVPDRNDRRVADRERPVSRPSSNPAAPVPNPQPEFQPPSQPTIPPRMQPPSESAASNEPPRAADALEWRVVVDPPMKTAASSDTEPAETVDTSKPVSITFPSDSHGSSALLMPARPSGLVVLGENSTEKRLREFWDVATRKRVGVMTGMRFNPHKQAVSPGGTYYAATTFSKPGVLVWDVFNSKPLGELPLTADGSPTCRCLRCRPKNESSRSYRIPCPVAAMLPESTCGRCRPATRRERSKSKAA